jgi:mono/diheme cytochrome c family protein
MKVTKRPAAPDEAPGGGRRSRRPTAGDIMKFGIALLSSLGVGSLINFFRKRSAMKKTEHEARHEAEIARALEEKRRVGHEVSDIRIRNVALVAGAMIVGAVVIYLALGGLFALFANREAQADVPSSPLAQTQQPPPEPRLQVAPAEDLAKLRAAEQQRLNSYGWIDQQAGVARIPIDRAMALIAQRGLPATSGGAGGQPTGATPQPSSVPGAGQNLPAATAAPQPTGVATPQSARATTGVAEGERLFTSLACAGCHLMDGSGPGPALKGVFGSQVALEGGATVTADEAYIRESILNPTAKVVAGRQPIMPSFQGRISEAELAQLVAYIKSLGQQK